MNFAWQIVLPLKFLVCKMRDAHFLFDKIVCQNVIVGRLFEKKNISM